MRTNIEKKKHEAENYLKFSSGAHNFHKSVEEKFIRFTQIAGFLKSVFKLVYMALNYDIIYYSLIVSFFASGYFCQETFQS